MQRSLEDVARLRTFRFRQRGCVNASWRLRLKDAPRLRHKLLREVLMGIGMNPLQSYQELYVWHVPSSEGAPYAQGKAAISRLSAGAPAAHPSGEEWRKDPDQAARQDLLRPWPALRKPGALASTEFRRLTSREIGQGSQPG